jgi:GTP-binding protein
MLEHLNAMRLAGTHRWTLQAIFTQADRANPVAAAKTIPALKKQLFALAPACLPPIFTAVGKSAMQLGVEGVRSSILEACDLRAV